MVELVGVSAGDSGILSQKRVASLKGGQLAKVSFVRLPIVQNFIRKHARYKFVELFFQAIRQLIA